MNLRKIVLGTLLSVLLLANIAWAAAAPEVTADAAVLMDAETGELLYDKNGDKREYPASTTKVMTCILALESGRLDRIVEVSANAADVESTRLRAGNQARMGDLLQQMMMVSDNGAATAVGESLAEGDIDYFAQKMNGKAAALGMTGTHFVNANGMPGSDHYSTAHDIARLMAYAIQNESFRNIIGKESANIYYIRPAGRVEYCETTDELLGSYEGLIGGKTGWTQAARGCFVAAATRGGRTLVAAVLHTSDDETRFSDARALLDYGFAQEAGE